MAQAKFKPDAGASQAAHTVYFEDATAENGFIGQSTSKTAKELEAEMRNRMGMLNGSILTITPGTYTEISPIRYGVEIVFAFGEMRGRFNVAALPLSHRKPTAHMKDKAMRQALFIVVRLLEAQFQAKHFLLDYAPLLPFLMDQQGRTFTEAMIDSGQFPDLHRELPAKAGK